MVKRSLWMTAVSLIAVIFLFTAVFIGTVMPVNAATPPELPKTEYTSPSSPTAPVPYDGVPVTPTKVNSKNYRTFGFSDETWQQYNGYYAIRDAKELYGFANIVRAERYPSMSAVLLNDIVINTSVSESDATYEWYQMIKDPTAEPAKCGYNGTFDGNGYSISGIYCNTTAENSQNGIFGAIAGNGVVKNLVIKNSLFVSHTNSGASVMGITLYGKVDACRVESSVTVKGKMVSYGWFSGTVRNDNGYTGVISNSYMAANLFSDINQYSMMSNYADSYKNNFSNNYTVMKKGSDIARASLFRVNSTNYNDSIPGCVEIISSSSDAHVCNPITHNRVEGTCYQAGIDAYTYCVVCDKLLSGSKTHLKGHGTTDTFNTLNKSDNSKHDSRCMICTEIIDSEQHFFEGINSYTCKSCDFSFLTPSASSPTELTFNQESFTLMSDLEVVGTLTVPVGSTLTVPDGVRLTVKGTIVNNGKIVNNGGVKLEGTYSGNGAFSCGVNATDHPVFNSDGFCRFCENEDYPQAPTLVDGVYQISNVGNLMWFSEFVSAGNTKANAVLTNDITYNSRDLSGLSGKTEGYRFWTPIGQTMNHDTGIDKTIAYYGTFDGQGYTVSGLYHFDYWSYAGNSGLFGIVGSGGVVKNVTVKNSYFASSSYLGAIAGELNGGLIENCHNVNTTVAAAARAGGIVGHISSGIVRNCTNTGNVKFFKVNDGLAFTSESLGGIAGNTSGVLEYCTNYGTVSGASGSTAAGISGQIYQGTVRNSVNHGNLNVENGTNFGGITGYQYHATIEYNLNFGVISGSGNLTAGIIGNPLGNGGKYKANYTTTGRACGVIDEEGCYTITTAEIADGRLAFELGLGQELGVDDLPSVGGPVVYRYFDANGVWKYTNNANYTCHHSGGKATCALPATCDGCRQHYGNKLEGDHKWSGKTDYSDDYCLVCGGRCGVDAPHSTNNSNYCSRCGDWFVPELAEDGFYEIKVYGHLMWFAAEVNAGNPGLNARLVNDISASALWHYDDRYIPIGNAGINDTENGYSGIFDGNGHIISLFPDNYSIDEDKVFGVFGNLLPGAVVKNLSVSNRIDSYNFKREGTNFVYDGDFTVVFGAIAGRVMEGATIDNCMVANATISVKNGTVGAIAGINEGTIKRSVSYGLTLTADVAGGIAGTNNGAIFDSFTSYGSVAAGDGAIERSEASISDERLKSGEITYKLVAAGDGATHWSQTVGSQGPRLFADPKEGGKVVYQFDLGAFAIYSNTAGKAALLDSYVIQSGVTLIIPKGVTVDIPAGMTLTNNGTLIKNGNLTGKGTLDGNGSFLVSEIEEGDLPTIADMVYDGADHTDDIFAIVNSHFSAFGKSFSLVGYTYSKSFTSVKDTGYYKITYANDLETYVIGFNVTALTVNVDDLSLEYEEAIYNGEEHQPLAVLSGWDISLGRDYTVSYEGNVKAGVATVIITFRGNFFGEFTKQFTITPAVIGDSAEITVPDSINFTGLELDPISVTVGGVVLRRGVDYEVDYENNIYPGEATATVTGIGDVSGEVNVTFTIEKNVFTVTVLDQVFPYNENISVKPFDHTMYEGEGIVDGHTVVLGELIDYSGTGETITVIDILDANGVSVIEYYDLVVLKTGEYHMFYETYSWDGGPGGNHWRGCVYNCDEIIDFGPHIGENATCIDHSVCEICDMYYQFATGVHTWEGDVCTVCGTENPYELWMDLNNDGQFNDDEIGSSSLPQALAFKTEGTYKMIKDVTNDIWGIGADGANLVIDLYGRTLNITAMMALQGADASITFIDTSPAKTGKIIGSIAIYGNATENTTFIFDGVSLESDVWITAGALILKNGSSVQSIECEGGVVRFVDSDLREVSFINPENTTIYVNDVLMATNAETGTLECASDHVWLEADCETAKHCRFCLKTDGEPLGHDSDPVTCETDEYCRRCETVITEALGHKVKILDSQDPGCDTTGLTQGSCCENCGEVYVAQEVTPALGHDPDKDDPTCEEGVGCTRCSAVLESALGHDSDPATCETDEYCRRCGIVITEAYGHSPRYQTTLCDVDNDCLRCGTVIEEAIGHDYKTEVGRETTCMYEGILYHTCQRCYDSYETYPSIKDHEYIQDLGEESTCTEHGFIGRVYCYMCGETKTAAQSLPLLPHKDEDGNLYCDSCGAYVENAHICEENEFGYCEVCKIRIKGQSVSLGSSISMKYFVEILDYSVIVDKTLTMSFVFRGETIVESASWDGQYYVFTLKGIAPEYIGENIEAYFLIDGERAVKKVDYSVRQNLLNLLKTYADDEELSALIYDILALGDSAQKAKDVNEDKLVSEGVEGYAPGERVPENKKAVEGNTDDTARVEKAELVTDGDVRIKFTFKLENIEDLRVELNGKKINDGLVYAGEGLYTFETDHVTVLDVTRSFTVKITKSGVMVSKVSVDLESIVGELIDNDSDISSEEKAFALALYNLGKSALEYAT